MSTPSQKPEAENPIEGMSSTMIESFISSVGPVLESANPPKLVTQKFQEFCQSLQDWGAGKLKDEGNDNAAA
jgi:hypothetical protein